MVNIRFDPGGIDPVGLHPYPKDGGMYKFIEPPFCIKGNPLRQPNIRLDNKKLALPVRSWSKITSLVSLPVYFTVTVELNMGAGPVPCALIT